MSGGSGSVGQSWVLRVEYDNWDESRRIGNGTEDCNVKFKTDEHSEEYLP